MGKTVSLKRDCHMSVSEHLRFQLLFLSFYIVQLSSRYCHCSPDPLEFHAAENIAEGVLSERCT